jgi:hypothetical protein
MVFPNTRKEPGSNHPDYHLVLAPIEPKSLQRSNADHAGISAARAAQAPLDDDLDGDEIPF